MAIVRRMEQAVFKTIVEMAYEMHIVEIVTHVVTIPHQDLLSIVLHSNKIFVYYSWPYGYEYATSVPCDKLKDLTAIPWPKCWIEDEENASMCAKEIVPSGTKKWIIELCD